MRFHSYIFNLTLLLLFASQCLGQQNYLPATVVIKGDTISGSIDFKEWSTGPFSINYKSEDGKSVKNFKPRDIQSFSVNGNYYVSSVCKLDISPVQLDQLSRNGEQTFRTDTLFLQVLVHSDQGIDQ